MEDIIMRVRHSKLLALIGAGILAVTTLVACGNSDATTAQLSVAESSAAESTVAASSEVASTETTAGLSGSISMVGSTSMEKLANALSEAFMEEYPDVTVTAEFVGSGAGIEAVTNGTADIGNSSRSLKDEEKAAGVAENIVAIDGIAVCVDPANEVADLTKEQLTNIYNGTVTNWKEVGGADEPISVIGREAGSGTRGAFEELLELLRQSGYQIKGGKVPSLLGADQKRFIRMDTLGENYTPDALRAIISGARSHTPKKKRSILKSFFLSMNPRSFCIRRQSSFLMSRG